MTNAARRQNLKKWYTVYYFNGLCLGYTLVDRLLTVLKTKLLSLMLFIKTKVEKIRIN